MGREDLIESQRSYIGVLEKKVSDLREEKELLKSLVQQVTEQWGVEVPPFIRLKSDYGRIDSWADRSKGFERVRSQLLEAAIRLAKSKNEPLHQNEIIAEAVRLHPSLKHVDESTLTARLREMCNPMDLLVRPRQGYYFPSKKAINLQEETV